jgi:colanic acid/amylovoran biosynthesis glycosyltransferase
MTGSRVALVVPVFPVRSETFIASKAVGLAAAGWDVHIVCQRFDAKLFGELPDDVRASPRGRVHAAWPHRPRWLAAALMPAALLRLLALRPAATIRYLREGGSLRDLYLDAELISLAPRIIHFEFGTLAVGRMSLAERLAAKTVVSFRGYDLNFAGLDDPAYYREVWARATAIHVLGGDLWRRAIERGCAPEKPHALISPAIDTEFFTPSNRERGDIVGTAERPLRILSVGRLEWKKGYEYAIEAVRMLLGQGVVCTYRIIGEGEFHTATAYARHESKLEEVVTLLRAAPRTTVRTELDQADVFLHPAVSEGFGNAVIEAQAMRLPVVCTDADGLAENVVHGETGFVVHRREAQQLSDALARLAADPGLRRRMGDAGRARALSRFRIADQIAAFGALYERVASLGPVADADAGRLSFGNDGSR